MLINLGTESANLSFTISGDASRVVEAVFEGYFLKIGVLDESFLGEHTGTLTLTIGPYSTQITIHVLNPYSFSSAATNSDYVWASAPKSMSFKQINFD